jgi:hypothetical protein
MPKRRKARAKPQKGLDRYARKKPMIRGESAPNRQFAKPFGVTMAGLYPLDSEAAYVSGLAPLQAPESRKRGRPTTADNFLEGFRNDWLSFFERRWHEIGWSLLEIRKRRASTIEEIQRLFEPLQGKLNCHLADCFLRGSPQPAEGKELRAKRMRVGKLYDEVQKMQSERREQDFSCAIAENALKETSEEYREAIEEEVKKKKGHLQELNENLQRAETEANDLDKKVRGWETHFDCSQLLDFLCKGKYAIKPFVLANALAGSPRTGWRQSLARCAKLERPSSYVHYPYGIFKAISKIWKRKSKRPELTVIEFFQAEIRKLKKRKQDGETYSYLSGDWRDLRMAIEKCSKTEQSDDFMPHAITRAFVNSRSRLKTQAQRILDEHEKLSP